MILRELERHATQNNCEGILCVAEDMTEAVPFEIKRVYYTYGAGKEVVRGHHAHKSLEQVLICLHGEIEVLLDDGRGNKETTILDDPSKGLYVGPLMWHTMKWRKEGSILLCLASDHYSEDDYIRSYDAFVSLKLEKRRGGGVDNSAFPLCRDTSIDFETRRVYYIYGAKRGVVRGHHAHKSLEQVLVCVKGAIEVTLDDGATQKKVTLDEPARGLYVGPSTWRTMEWLEDGSILLVLASRHYDEADYIRDYEEFAKWAKGNANTV